MNDFNNDKHTSILLRKEWRKSKEYNPRRPSRGLFRHSPGCVNRRRNKPAGKWCSSFGAYANSINDRVINRNEIRHIMKNIDTIK